MDDFVNRIFVKTNELKMSYLHKEYWNIGGQEIKVAISFNRDKINWATYQPKKIGYQVICVPVKLTTHKGFTIEESQALTGFSDCLLEIERQSAKRLQTAIAELQNRKEKYLQYFKDKYGWEDTEPAGDKVVH